MKKVLITLIMTGLISVAITTLFSCSNDNEPIGNDPIPITGNYITDEDFHIEITNWISYSDLTDDGIDIYTLNDQGVGEEIVFYKDTGRFVVEGYDDDEFADTSENGLLVFENYWGEFPKIIDFTVDNQYTVYYDSRNDPEASSFELIKIVAYFNIIN
ncbi:MAG: hypothetical protein GY834_09915 [Bacteroidetes bacterium]|nr:hypothetical protein [Bacteroidota bacterium]